MGFVMSLDIGDFLRLITKAAEKREESRTWDMWIAQYPHMDETSFVPFSEFHRRQLAPVTKPRSAAELLEEAERIRQQLRSRQEVTNRGDL